MFAGRESQHQELQDAAREGSFGGGRAMQASHPAQWHTGYVQACRAVHSDPSCGPQGLPLLVRINQDVVK